MASIISADNGTVSGSAGLKSSADSSGILAFQTGANTTAITINASQNVGIGTASPGYKLEVNSGSGAFSARFTTTTTNALLVFGDSGTTGVGPFVGSAGNNLTFGRAGVAEYMRIDSSGNVGIGTSSPGAKLEIGPLGVFRMQTGSTVFNVTPTAGATDTLVWNTSNSGSAFAWNTNSTERMRLDPSGNLGLGVTPSVWSQGKGFEISAVGEGLWGNGLGDIWMLNGAYFNGGFKYSGTTKATAYRQGGGTTDGSHSWHIAGSGTAGNAISFTQAMTLSAAGDLLLGTTALNAQGKLCISANSAANQGITIKSTGAANIYYVLFQDSANNIAGRIEQTGSTSVSYVTTSDYRLKENVAPMTGALAKVAALKPVTYNWKFDGTTGQGFIAHELQEVCPHAVCGEKDAVNRDGSIKPQGIDTSFLVATLTAAIQELKAEFDAYKLTHP